MENLVVSQEDSKIEERAYLLGKNARELEIDLTKTKQNKNPQNTNIS